ncbi:MAG: hypothetical protein IJN82_02135, partial [Clostridia bacterium]|nr:hypothetical protein [Clostridia bacterium]
TEASHPTEYTPSLFSKIVENEIALLGLAENIAFTCQDDNRFTVEGEFKNLGEALKKYDLSNEMQEIASSYNDKPFYVEGHLGINDKGNATLILDRITSNGQIIPADIATELIEDKTDLTKLVDVPFDSITLSEKGAVFEGELPLFIRIALYKLPPLSESE